MTKKWDENTSLLVKKANARLQLLRKATSFTKSIEDLKSIYVKSIVEQSSAVWNSSLTEENTNDTNLYRELLLVHSIAMTPSLWIINLSFFIYLIGGT